MIRPCIALSTFALALASAAAAQAQDVISWYCGGGFTGGGGGVTIKDDGEIIRVGHATFAAPTTSTAVRVDLGAYRRWAQTLDAAKFDELAVRQVGNFTCSLTWKHGNIDHVVSWIGAIAPKQVPEAVVRVAQELNAVGQ